MRDFISLFVEPAGVGLLTHLVAISHGFTFANSFAVAVIVGILFYKIGNIEVNT